MKSQILPCTSAQLNLDAVLTNGQSFRWKKIISENKSTFVGIAKQRVWKIWRKDANNIEYKVLHKFNNENNGEEDHKILYNYFQLDIDLENLYNLWSMNDNQFLNQIKSNPKMLQGIRILRQDLFETLFSFICSANNNIIRISRLVEKFCELYGTKKVFLKNGKTKDFYNFPNLIQLDQNLSGMEALLRESGFGYRAKYISETIKKLNSLNGETWLESLKNMSYEEAKLCLMKLPGVGPKVADCICLMGLNKHHVVPVDTHVFQITCKLYANQIKHLNEQMQKKTLSKKINEEISQFYVKQFGPYAGWAHSVLFSNRLRHLKK